MTRIPRWLLAAAVGAAVAVALVWFEPQALFIDDEIDEDVVEVERPGDTAGASAQGAEAGAAAEGPREISSSEFRSIDHETRGTALLTDLNDGRRILRLEDFETSNGPDLFVYLSRAGPGSAENEYDDDIVNLGRLKGNVGDQNYEIPTAVDLSAYRTIVIWCDRFNSAFGEAPLEAGSHQ